MPGLNPVARGLEKTYARPIAVAVGLAARLTTIAPKTTTTSPRRQNL